MQNDGSITSQPLCRPLLDLIPLDRQYSIMVQGSVCGISGFMGVRPILPIVLYAKEIGVGSGCGDVA